MRSKVILILVISVFFFNLSCSDFLSGQKKEQEVIEIQGTELDCLDPATEVLRKFDREKTEPQKLVETLQCFQKSLAYFKAKTKGSVQNPDNYTIDNLRSFFSKFLGDSNSVSEKMASELMRLKAALFGGEIYAMSKVELQKLIDFMGLLQNEIGILKPHWKTLMVAKQNQPVSLADISAAHQTLMSTVRRLIESTQLSKADYELDNFIELMQEIERFTESEAKKPASNKTDAGLQIVQWMPLFEALKLGLFGPRVEMNSLSKWREAFRMVGELHRGYMLYFYQFEPHSFYSREALRTGDEMLALLIKLLDSSWIIGTTGISFEITEKLFQALYKQNMLPEGVTAKGIDETYRGLVARVFEREARFPKETVTALEKRHLTFIKVEYEIWRSAQDFVDTFPDTFVAKTVDEKLKGYSPRTFSRFSVPNPQTILDAWGDWKHHLSQEIPLLYMNSGEILISPFVRDMRNWPWYSLARQNIMRSLSRTLLLGYGVKKTVRLADTGINEQSFLDWYNDNTTLGVEIKAFDPRTPNSGTRSFFESNHFVYSGDGDEVADRQEVYEFVNIIFSSGLAGLKTIQEDMIKSKCGTSNLDIFGNPWLDEKCFKNILRQKFHIFFKNLPGLVHYVRAFTPEQWDQFYDDLLDFSRNDPKEKGRIETSDLRTLVVILHYIESMYIRFDTDRDDRLSKAELIEGSKRFIPFFKKQFALESSPGGIRDGVYRSLVSQGFACMVLTGAMPSISGCSKVFLLDAWDDRFSDRRRILRTLNQLKSKLM